MATVTLTASLAQPSFTPPSTHTGVTLAGAFDGGGLSLSGSGRLLMAKIPADAKDVSLIVRHELNGAATNVMNYGLRSGLTTSATASAIIPDVAAAGVVISTPTNPVWEQSAGERFKYVIGQHVSGTVTASLTMRFWISYRTGS